MPSFTWKGRTRAGQLQEGQLLADSRDAAVLMLRRRSTYIEKVVKLKSQVKAAMIYLVAIIVIACFVVAIILWKVIPVFTQLFAGLGGEMPLITRVVISCSNFLVRFFWLVGLVVGAGIGAVYYYHRTYRGRRVIDGLLLRIPIIGMLLRKISGAPFCRPRPTPTSPGVPILDGLASTA